MDDVVQDPVEAPGAGRTRPEAEQAPFFNATSIPALVRARGFHQPDETAFVELVDGERETRTWTRADLMHQAAAVADALAHCCAPGERVLILHDPGLDYVAAFLGSLQAGVTAVPCVPPQGRRAVNRLFAIVADARPAVVLSTKRIGDTEFRLRGEHWREAGPEWLTTDALTPAASPETVPVRPRDPALLQYTSGSTGRPKGVMISHDNLMANSRAAVDWLGPDPDRRGLSWLPPFHDMGLMGGIVQPVYEGFPVWLMAPGHFIQNPARWLKAIDRYRITATGAPNFAYDLCVDQIGDDDLAGLDLSCLRVAFCGSEPVSVRTLERFSERFRASGFDPDAFNPCYGMAEATLLVSGKPGTTQPVFRHYDIAGLQQGWARRRDAGDERGRTLISCGRVVPELELAIVDPDTGAECGPCEIGEIRVAGASIGQGYWNRPDASAESFHTDAAGRRWLCTGDLGFVDDGEVFVTGRIKDLIIVAGQNHFPQDIEDSIRPVHPAIHPNGIAAVGVPVGEGEGVAAMVELRRGVERPDEDELRRAINAAVVREHGVRLEEVILTRVGGVPRTTSGKVQRRACRELILEGRRGPGE